MSLKAFKSGFLERLSEECLYKKSDWPEALAEVGQQVLRTAASMPYLTFGMGGLGTAGAWLLLQKAKEDRLRARLREKKIKELDKTLSALESSGLIQPKV